MEFAVSEGVKSAWYFVMLGATATDATAWALQEKTLELLVRLFPTASAQINSIISPHEL